MMTKPRNEKLVRRIESKKIQLRGEPLKAHLRAVIEEEATKAREIGKAYIYNASALSRETGVSRETLRKHQDFIDNVLKSLAAERRTSDGNATFQTLRLRIDKIETERDEARAKYRALLAHHVQIFEILHMNSVDLSSLGLVVQSDVGLKNGKCLLCGSSVHREWPKSMQKIISFGKKRR